MDGQNAHYGTTIITRAAVFNKQVHRAIQAEVVVGKFQRNQLLSVFLEAMYNS